MRDIHAVINQLRKHIPVDQRPLLYELEDIYSSASYRAPEIRYIDWQTLQLTLTTRIGMVPTEDWEFQVLSIFSTLSVEEVKREALSNG